MPQIKPLSSELQKIAVEELGEVAERIPEYLQALKTWIWQQPHLNARTDDQFLIQFLRGSKYKLEVAKEKLDKFYTIRTRYPEYFAPTNVDDPIFRTIQNAGGYITLPNPLNGCGPRIGFLRFTKSPQDFAISDMMQGLAAVCEVNLMRDPYACICGIEVVVDFSRFTFQHVLALTPTLLSLIKSFYMSFPIRIKAIYMINLATYAEQVSKMLLPYVPEKLKNRVYVCGSNIDELAEHLPRKYFPQEYGGENGSLDVICAENNKIWDEYREYFKQNAEYGIDERLRPGGPWQNDDLGYGGSFRQINVD